MQISALKENVFQACLAKVKREALISSLRRQLELCNSATANNGGCTPNDVNFGRDGSTRISSEQYPRRERSRVRDPEPRDFAWRTAEKHCSREQEATEIPRSWTSDRSRPKSRLSKSRSLPAITTAAQTSVDYPAYCCRGHCVTMDGAEHQLPPKVATLADMCSSSPKPWLSRFAPCKSYAANAACVDADGTIMMTPGSSVCDLRASKGSTVRDRAAKTLDSSGSVSPDERPPRKHIRTPTTDILRRLLYEPTPTSSVGVGCRAGSVSTRADTGVLTGDRNHEDGGHTGRRLFGTNCAGPLSRVVTEGDQGLSVALSPEARRCRDGGRDDSGSFVGGTSADCQRHVDATRVWKGGCDTNGPESRARRIESSPDLGVNTHHAGSDRGADARSSPRAGTGKSTSLSKEEVLLRERLAKARRDFSELRSEVSADEFTARGKDLS